VKSDAKICPTAWDISGEASHPDGRASHPDGEASHPDERASHPDGRASHPDGEASHPDERASHPDGEASHPDGRASHPDGEASDESVLQKQISTNLSSLVLICFQKTSNDQFGFIAAGAVGVGRACYGKEKPKTVCTPCTSCIWLGARGARGAGSFPVSLPNTCARFAEN